MLLLLNKILYCTEILCLYRSDHSYARQCFLKVLMRTSKLQIKCHQKFLHPYSIFAALFLYFEKTNFLLQQEFFLTNFSCRKKIFLTARGFLLAAKSFVFTQQGKISSCCKKKILLIRMDKFCSFHKRNQQENCFFSVSFIVCDSATLYRIPTSPSIYVF